MYIYYIVVLYYIKRIDRAILSFQDSYGNRSYILSSIYFLPASS